MRNRAIRSSNEQARRSFAQPNRDINFNLATEEYLFEHVEQRNPSLFLWRNRPAIILGKNQNPWKECRVQEMEADGVALARRPTGGGCVYRDLGDTGFSFITPHSSFEDQRDFKTMNNDVLLDALSRFGIEAEASGRNDLVVAGGRKISGSAWRIGSTASGKSHRILHHGTMLLDVDLGALGRYLSPNKLKMESKGIASVAARVVNLVEEAPEIDHAGFCDAAAAAFEAKHPGRSPNRQTLAVADLEKIPELMAIYERYAAWEWRFGSSPSFSHSLERKFDWALVDVHVDVQKGVITGGRVFSDCLVPPLIDAFNDELSSAASEASAEGSLGSIAYDVAGVAELCARVRARLGDDEGTRVARDEYIPQLQEWLSAEI
jgi:lipoate-protein ligase A